MVESLFNLSEQTHRQQGMASKIKKIVAYADLIKTEKFRPDSRQLFFYRSTRS